MAATRLTPPEPAPPPIPEVRGTGLRVRLGITVLAAMLPPVLVAFFIDLDTVGVRSLLIFVAALAASASFVAYMARQIVDPLLTLTNDAHALAAGVSGHRSAITSNDEIGALAAALNRMAETVEKRNAALADNERRYRFLFDSNPLPMWAWDADTMNILAVNEAAVEKYGYEREQFLSLRITDLLEPSELPRFGGARLPFSESRQNAGTWMHRTATGRRIEMEVVTTSSRRLGRASWLSVGIDVTARREAERALARSEEQLRQAQKMEAIGTFAGGISHDFSNLLTGMLGYCDLLLATMPDDSPHREDVSEIRALAVRGTELSRQVLAISRRQVLQPIVCDANTVVHGLDRLLRRLIGENIELTTRLSTEVRSTRADVAQLEQVLLNLVGNARDAMPNGGKLELETALLSAAERDRLGLDAARDWMALRVKDTGVGMTTEVMAHIFEPFFTTKEKGKGTGLGLALASSMIDQIGGEIRVDSAPGLGTTVHLLLPHLDERATQTPVLPEPSPALTGHETILLAEDEDAVRAVTMAALERRGYRVLAAPDGETALAISNAFPGVIDLLITDVVMPGMNGRELAERLERTRPGLPVVFVSGYTDDAVLLQGISTDARTLLPKPFTSFEIAQRVRAALDHTRASSGAP
ncbi:MAG: response regulator [Gemmatimonadaceae bacterium]|nr:response regulator [Gemmatimonadaceae bacterium]